MKSEKQNTEDAEQVMVVSFSPIVLGEPQEKDKERFEQVAFMGQVPVKQRKCKFRRLYFTIWPKRWIRYSCSS